MLIGLDGTEKKRWTGPVGPRALRDRRRDADRQRETGELRKVRPSPRYVGTISVTVRASSPPSRWSTSTCRTALPPSHDGTRPDHRCAAGWRLARVRSVLRPHPLPAAAASRAAAPAAATSRRPGPLATRKPPPRTVAMPGAGRRTAGDAHSAARLRPERAVAVEQRRRNGPDPAVTSVTTPSATVRSTLPVPPPLTNARSAKRRMASTVSARRAVSSRIDRAWIARTTGPYSGRPDGASPTPATCASYAISPTSSKPGRSAMCCARRTTSAGPCNGDRRTPTCSRPFSRRHDASRSMHTRGFRRWAGGDWASMRSGCATSSIISVTAAGHLSGGGKRADRGAVGGGVGHEDVGAHAGLDQPAGFGKRGSHDARVSGPSEYVLEQRAAPDGLAGDSNRRSGCAPDEVGRVVAPRLQQDDCERRVEICRRGIEAAAVHAPHATDRPPD